MCDKKSKQQPTADRKSKNNFKQKMQKKESKYAKRVFENSY